MKLELPANVRNVLDVLENNGYAAYIVGGCLRDTLLNLPPHDWDIATNARPESVKNLFPRHFENGAFYGTVGVITDDGNIEVTTFRSDGIYLDHRRPESVKFSDNIEEDLSRRDFTINAMAYSPKTGLIDLFNGKQDIKYGIINTVGDPIHRFTEDALRILRAFRFAIKLKFRLSSDVHAAIHNLTYLLSNISIERIQSEISLICDTLDWVRLLHRTGISPTKFKFDNTTKNKLIRLLSHLDTPISDIKRDAILIGPDIFEDLLIYRNMQTELEQFRAHNHEPMSITSLALNGSDLIALGYTGSEIGQKLRQLLDHVLDHPENNTREILLKQIIS